MTEDEKQALIQEITPIITESVIKQIDAIFTRSKEQALLEFESEKSQRFIGS